MNKIILMHITDMGGVHDEGNGTKADYANAIMESPYFKEYIAKNGYHFTCALADHVTKGHLVNTDGSVHNWTSAQVKSAIGLTELPVYYTWGDLAYLANWIYSDNVPEPYVSDGEVIVAAKRYISDPDGYDGMVFMRWLTDMIGRGQNIDWGAFL